MKKSIFVVLAVSLLASCSAPQIKILAHRGWCTEKGEVVVDENTLTALRRAQELGADAVEFDVHMTADSCLIIRHDTKISDELNCQKSMFADIRAYRLPFGEQIPTLHEWLAQASETPDIDMYIEIKSHKDRATEDEVIRLTLEEVKKMDMMGQVHFFSFNPKTCDEIIRQEPSARVNYNSSSVHDKLTPDIAYEKGYEGVSYNSAVWINHPDWAARCKELGLETFFWMVNDGYSLGIARDLGMTCVTTDYYDILKAL